MIRWVKFALLSEESADEDGGEVGVGFMSSVNAMALRR